MWANSCRGRARNSTWTRPSQLLPLVSASMSSAALSNVSGLLRPFCFFFSIKCYWRFHHFIFTSVYTCCGSYSVDWTAGDPSARSSSIQALATSSWTSSDCTLFSLAFCCATKRRRERTLFALFIHMQKASRVESFVRLFTARLAAMVRAEGGKARVHKWPVPVRALTLFRKWGLMDKLWRTEFFQRSSFALKYGNLSLCTKWTTS